MVMIGFLARTPMCTMAVLLPPELVAVMVYRPGGQLTVEGRPAISHAELSIIPDGKPGDTLQDVIPAYRLGVVFTGEYGTFMSWLWIKWKHSRV
jgi:hypothetical protein